MINVYTDADFLSAYKQRRRYLHIFIGVTAIYVAICIGLVIYHANLPYGSVYTTWPKITAYALSVLYVLFAFPFMAICFRRVNRYYRMLAYINEGIKAEETNYFYTFRAHTQQQDNVDVVVGVFAEKNNRNKEWREREIYLDPEKELPDFNNGDLVHLITQSNFLVHYEILERHAFDFSLAEDEPKKVGLGVDEN